MNLLFFIFFLFTASISFSKNINSCYMLFDNGSSNLKNSNFNLNFLDIEKIVALHNTSSEISKKIFDKLNDKNSFIEEVKISLKKDHDQNFTLLNNEKINLLKEINNYQSLIKQSQEELQSLNKEIEAMTKKIASIKIPFFYNFFNKDQKEEVSSKKVEKEKKNILLNSKIDQRDGIQKNITKYELKLTELPSRLGKLEVKIKDLNNDYDNSVNNRLQDIVERKKDVLLNEIKKNDDNTKHQMHEIIREWANLNLKVYQILKRAQELLSKTLCKGNNCIKIAKNVKKEIEEAESATNRAKWSEIADGLDNLLPNNSYNNLIKAVNTLSSNLSANHAQNENDDVHESLSNLNLNIRLFNEALREYKKFLKENNDINRSSPNTQNTLINERKDLTTFENIDFLYDILHINNNTSDSIFAAVNTLNLSISEIELDNLSYNIKTLINNLNNITSDLNDQLKNFEKSENLLVNNILQQIFNNKSEVIP